jgi:site-specific DNA-methyltransferase (adenine-specific)
VISTNNVVEGDSLEILKGIDESCIDLVLTDPPYFLDKLDSSWDSKEVSSTKNMKVVTSLPSGMRFDKDQSKRFYDWYLKVSKEICRVLKPGGFFFSFSSPRLYHRMACAIEDAGFFVKDQFIWLYTQNQPKAMSLNHVIDRLKIPDSEKESLKVNLSGWKTPQLKSCHEPIVMAQKPLEGSFLDNYRKHEVGLVNTDLRIGEGMFPSNVVSTNEFDEVIDRYFLVNKPSKKEKGEYNFHKTVKPVDVCRYLIALTTRENDLVLDPFAGSGTTLVAAKQIKRNFIGIDLNSEYVIIAKQRLSDVEI